MQIDLSPPRDPSQYPFATDYQVRLADADAMGIVHHSRYLPYLEETRYSWIRALAGPDAIEDLGIAAPVVEAHVRYLAPARARDLIRVHVRCPATSAARFAFSYLVRRPADDTTLLLGSTVHAYLDTRTGRPGRIPGWLAEALAGGEPRSPLAVPGAT